MKRLAVEPLTDDEKHRLRLVLTHSTYAERLEWLEDLRLMFGVEHLKRQQELRWRMEERAQQLNSPPPIDR